jgi:thiol-disulfide isomerase/thioredoxin
MRFARGVVLLCCVGLSLCAFAQSDDEGQSAPRFSAKTTAGERFTNESVKGKVVLLQFWATWCKYCRADQSTVDELDKEFASKGLLTLAVDVGEDKKIVKKYLDQNPRTCRIVLTSDTNLAAMYAANAYPIYVVIDRDGKIAAEERGAMGERGLRRMLERAGLQGTDESRN